MPALPERHNGVENFGERKVTRRGALGFLGLFVATTAGFSVELAMVSPYLRGVWETIKNTKNLFIPEPLPCSATTATTTYSQEALQRTYALVAGDSIGRGFWEKNKPSIPAAEYAVDTINHSSYFRNNFGANWDRQTVAEEGSTTKDVLQQLNNTKLNHAFKTERNIDFWLSVGGNDIIQYLGQKISGLANKASGLAQNPVSDDFFTLDQEFFNALRKYKQDLERVLQNIAKKNGKGNLRRLIMEGLPNLGITDQILYVGKNSETLATIQVKGNPAAEFFLQNASMLFNNTMKEVINEMLGKSPQFDILFLDNFDYLPKNDLLGEHPLPKGQQQMAANFFYRALHAGINLGEKLYPHLPPRRQQPIQPQLISSHEPLILKIAA